MIDKQRIKQEKLKPHQQYENEKIQVLIRKRPIFAQEEANGEIDCISCANPKVIVHEPKLKVDQTKHVQPHKFYFENTFNQNVIHLIQDSNQDIYQNAISYLIPGIFNNGVLTCFAYGQTGSGKTYTMTGIQELVIRDLHKIQEEQKKVITFYLSFYEIYGGACYDLLNGRQKLEVLEDKHGNGLVEVPTQGENDMQDQIINAQAVRTTHSTVSNETSSRSHAICQILIKGDQTGKLTLVDLAGSERAQDTQDNDKNRRIEGADINKSLLALKECIRAIACGQSRIPFRGAKLTLVLQNSFTQKDSKIVMIGCISPNSSSADHSLNTLRYADRLKSQKKPDDIEDSFEDETEDSKINNQDSSDKSIQKQYHFQQKKKPSKSISEQNICNLSDNVSQGKKKISQQIGVKFPPISSHGKNKHQNDSNKGKLKDLSKLQDQMQMQADQEQVFGLHINSIKDDAIYLKNESDLVASIQRQGKDFDIEDYINGLDSMIQKKLSMYKELESKLKKFKSNYFTDKHI